MHYDNKYYDWQKHIGEIGGKIDLAKFEKYIGGDDDIVDFGCGGGFLLKRALTKGHKYGVEINPYAREQAIDNGIDAYESIGDIKDNSCDILISNHALEHVFSPYDVIVEAKRVVRPGGKLVICVPSEVKSKVEDNNIDMHLYTWTPQNLKNLFETVGGLKVIEAKRLYCSWSLRFVGLVDVFGGILFKIACYLFSKLFKEYQTLVVAEVDNKQNSSVC